MPTVISHNVVDYPSGFESATFTLPMPAGATAGDMIVLTPECASPTATITAVTSGVQVLAAVGENPAANHAGAVYKYKVPSSPPGSLTLTWSAAVRGNLNWALVRDGDSDAAAFAIAAWGTSDPTVAPAVTAAAGALVLGGISVGSGTVTATFASPWSLLNAGLQRRGYLASKGVQASAGSTGTASFDLSAGSSGSRAWQLAIPPASGGGTSPAVVHATVGAATSTGFTVAVKTANTTSARLKVGSNTAVTADVVFSSAVVPDADGYATLTVTGLPARARDYYALELTGSSGTVTTGLVGSPRRVPAPDVPASFTIALGSCWDPGAAIGTPSFGRILAHDPVLFFHLGDWDYEDNASTSQASHRADQEAPIVADSGLRSLIASVPTVYVKSDHDGDANEQGPGAWTAPNRAATLQMFPYGTRPNSSGLYHAFTVGRVRFIVIDTRYLGNNSTTRLGATQKAWLKSELERGEPLKVLVQDGTWISNEAPGVPGVEDDWPTYSAERQEIADHWESNGVGTLITVHGDQHAISADDGSNNPWGGFASFCAAPFRNESSTKTLSQSGWSHGFYPPVDGTNVAQYGTVTFTDTGDYLTASFNGYDTADTVRVSLTVGTEGYAPPAQVTGASASSLTSPSGRWVKTPHRPLWWDTVNGAWRAILPTSTGHRVYTLNPAGNVQGAVVDNRQGARVTAVHNAGTTYVFAAGAGADGGVLRRYNSSWVQVGSSSTVTLTNLEDLDTTPVAFTRLSNGHLWLAWKNPGTGNIQVRRSTDDGATWATSGNNVGSIVVPWGTTTGIVSLVEAGPLLVLIATANDGVGRIVRTIAVDSTAISATNWTTEALPGLPSGVTSDDHLDAIALPDGQVFAVSKTSDPISSAQPLIYGLVRASGGTWSAHTIEPGPDDGARYTRPTVTLVGSSAHVVYGSIESPRDLSRRTMPLDAVGAWSGRSALMGGPDWADSGVVPAPRDLAASSASAWPVVAQNRATGAVWVAWQPTNAVPSEIPGYVGAASLEAMYLGSTPVEAIYLGSLQLV